ncbi:MBL fold metallo-hydrolase [Planctomycetota bacterium]
MISKTVWFVGVMVLCSSAWAPISAAEPVGDLNGDLRVDWLDLQVLAAHWLADYREPVYIQWLGHASVKIWHKDKVVYVDPRNLGTVERDADLVLVTHSHSDHYQASTINNLADANAIVVMPTSMSASQWTQRKLAPGETKIVSDVPITAIPAYNTNKSYHQKSRNWLGYVIEIGGLRIYLAGDTDLTDEMKALTDIDVAFLPAGGTYTMTATEAADATHYFKPKLAIPYHYGDIVGNAKDASTFTALAAVDVRVMVKNETIFSNDWFEVIDPPTPPVQGGRGR